VGRGRGRRITAETAALLEKAAAAFKGKVESLSLAPQRERK
jgi:hypothetical protein